MQRVNKLFHSIRFRVMVTILFINTLIFGFLSYYSSVQLSELPPLTFNRYQEIVDARAREFSNELDGLANQIEMLSYSPIIKSMDLDIIQPYLVSLLQQERFLNFTISDKDGIAWTTYGSIIDISLQQQYKEIVLNNHSHSISDPFKSPYVPYDVPIITIAYPIKQNNAIVGIINGVVTTDFILRMIDDVSLKEIGFAWVINNNGQLIAHPDQSIKVFEEVTSFTSLEDTTLLKNDAGSFDYTDKTNTKMLGIYATITHTNNWKLILSIEEKLAYIEVSTINNTLRFSTLIAMMVQFLFILWYSKRQIKPILDLQKTFKEAASGNFDVRANETINNEIGDTAKSFNTMLAQIKQLTFVDPITGLNNYLSFLHDTPFLIAKQHKENHVCYLMIVSIENFKTINTFYGYEFGNKVLYQLGHHISSILNENECIARYFSDELILTLCAFNEAKIKARVQQILAIAQQPLMISNVELKLSINVGVSIIKPTIPLQQIIQEATLAKHKAKYTENNNIIYYDKSIQDDLQFKQGLEAALASAIENNEFYLLYQPIYNTNLQKTIGYEALLRWNHPQYKSIPISTVIEIAETNGFINELGIWVFKNASSKLKKLHESDPSLFMSINVSPIQLQSNNFLSIIEDTIKESKVPASTICLEITENSTMLDVIDKKIILNHIKALGVLVSIDDFGTGYSSLSYLSQLPIDAIKIDKQFIQQIDKDNYTHTLIASVIAIAKALDLMVVAEGVENQHQQRLLEKLNCFVIQGYYINKPISLED